MELQLNVIILKERVIKIIKFGINHTFDKIVKNYPMPGFF